MKEFRDKVMVIIGTASGITRGLANRWAQEGMVGRVLKMEP